ncbi:sugar transferase [Allomesorhizobium camelthorni]|uniref:Sugar transferase n=1 Tax=Allomesorhizobium camelthorni TaxID=475069 RepID=A0A6G4WD08_9HYPH|nr:sugar transferase [Mesorhizobium camelthorni]NGO52218.1 sugar transferase [Mesorhizobium camelthorni]
MKRAFDIVLAAIGLVVAAPLFLAAVILIRLTSPGPAIFRQIRVGLDEKPFTCLKLRTMYCETGNVPTHEAGASSITPVGKLLRRFKFDELPQLWNVLMGDMSFVGPRPCLPSQTTLIAARRAYGLYAICPGITGVAQVAGVDMSEPEKLAVLDAVYLRDMSLAADIRLILATALGSGQGDQVRSVE